MEDNEKIYFISMIIMSILISIVGIFIIYENYFSNDNKENNETEDKFYIIAEGYDKNEEGKTVGSSLYGINEKAEMTKLVTYPKSGFANYDVYKNNLYYISEDYLYKLDLTNKEYISEKLFKVNVDWDMLVDDKYAYIIGEVDDEENPFQMYKYDLLTGKETILITSIMGKKLLDTKNNLLYYSERTKEGYGGGLHQYNLNTGTKNLIMEDEEFYI